MKRLIFIATFLSALIGVCSCSDLCLPLIFADGKVVIHGKISEQLNLRTNKYLPRTIV